MCEANEFRRNGFFLGGTGGGVQRYFEHSRNILLLAWPLAEFLPSI